MHNSYTLRYAQGITAGILCPLAARINTPQADAPALTAAPLPPPLAGQPPLLPSMATELGRVCMGLGMGPPEFAFLRNRQVSPSHKLHPHLSSLKDCVFK